MRNYNTFIIENLNQKMGNELGKLDKPKTYALDLITHFLAHQCYDRRSAA